MDAWEVKKPTSKNAIGNLPAKSKKFWSVVKGNVKAHACSTPELGDDKIFGILNTYKKKRDALNFRWTTTDSKGLRKESGGRMRSMSQYRRFRDMSVESRQLLRGSIPFTEDRAKRLFDNLDRDHDHMLNLIEFRQLLKLIGVNEGMQEKEFRLAARRDFDSWDSDHNSRLSREEFVAYLRFLLTDTTPDDVKLPALQPVKEEKEKEKEKKKPELSSLQEALVAGDWTQINLFLGMDLTHCLGGSPPIVVAARHGHVKIVRKLAVHKHLDRTLLSAERAAILASCATLSKTVQRMQRTVKDLYPNAYARYEMLLQMQKAEINNDIDLAKSHLKAVYFKKWGTGTVQQDSTSRPVFSSTTKNSAQREFIEACRNGRSTTVKRLIRARADINALDERHSTPLMHATWFGHYDTVKVLIESKAEMTGHNLRHNTAMHFAAEKGHRNIIFLMLRHAMACSKLKNTLGYQPWKLAGDLFLRDVCYAATKQPKGTPQEVHEEVEERSFKHRVINSNRKEGTVNLLREQINQTLKKNDLLSLKILLGINANEEDPLDDATLSVLRTYDKFFLNALHYACAFANTAVVALLLDKKADLHATTKFGNNALHLAYNADNRKMIKLILSKDDDQKLANAKNKDHKVPQECARRSL